MRQDFDLRLCPPHFRAGVAQLPPRVVKHGAGMSRGNHSRWAHNGTFPGREPDEWSDSIKVDRFDAGSCLTTHHPRDAPSCPQSLSQWPTDCPCRVNSGLICGSGENHNGPHACGRVAAARARLLGMPGQTHGLNGRRDFKGRLTTTAKPCSNVAVLPWRARNYHGTLGFDRGGARTDGRGVKQS